MAARFFSACGPKKVGERIQHRASSLRSIGAETNPVQDDGFFQEVE